MRLSPEIMRSLDKLNFTEPTQVQSAGIVLMKNKEDLLAQAPTGSGKTAAFGIPLIENIDTGSRNVQSIILCPTRELALQTTSVIRELATFMHDIRTLTIYGGEPIQRQISALRRRPQIIVATPGRLLDHIGRRTIRLDNVTTVVLDEADQMLDMGFRGDIEKILNLTPKERQTVLFSATLSKEVRRIAGRFLKNPKEIMVEQKALTVDQVSQFYSEVPRKAKQDALFQLLKENNFISPLVFTGTKRMARTLSKQLNQNGYQSDALHGDLRQSQRNSVMRRFKGGKVRILVATDVAARGLDIDDIDAVVNYDIPGDYDSYVHRIGRTGRAMRKGTAFTLISTDERSKLKEISAKTMADIQHFPLAGEVLEDITPTSAPEKSSGRPPFKPKRRRGNRNFRRN